MSHGKWIVLIVMFLFLFAVPISAVELDADNNGYMDENKGGTNKASFVSALTSISAGQYS